MVQQIKIDLPALSGTREQADEMHGANLPDGPGPINLVLMSRDVLTTTDSFVDQLVKLFYESAGADLHVSTAAAPARLLRQLNEALARYEISSDHLHVNSIEPVAI